MRVIEPKQQSKQTVYKKRSNKKLLITLFFMIGMTGVLAYAVMTNRKPTQQSRQQDPIYEEQTISTVDTPNKTDVFKQFTGQQFKDLYYSVAYPNTQQIKEPIPITGNEDADNVIRDFAEKRGYKPTVIPQSSIVKINEPRLEGDDLLQPLSAAGWESLKQAAKADNIPLSIISAYRSPEWQRDLFMQRLLANGTNAAQVAAGIGSNAVKLTLSTAAVPGYSRHHTGYTIDLWCEDGSGTFIKSTCYSWISNDNYLHAKQSGWIPSYPEGTDLQGPEPEPWEYVWVGKEVLTEQ